ncbi:HAMP domain-containing protein [Xaviernesmea oryzae]|nr:HAMP domain-containing protein [Xaviernesmea oryzae]
MACFGVFSLGVALYSTHQISNIDGRYSDLMDHETTAALNLARANRFLQGARAAIGDLLMSRSDELNARAENELKEATESFSKFMDKAIAAMPQRSDISELKGQGLDIISKLCAPTIAAGQAATEAKAVTASQDMFLQSCQPAFAALSPRLTAMVAQIVEATDKIDNDVSAQATSTITTTLVAVFVGLVSVLIGGFVAVRTWLVRPIQQISATMNVLADGNLTIPVGGTERRDEIGLMAKAVQVFKDNGLRARGLEEEAASARSMSEAERVRVAQLDHQRTLEISQATSGLAEGLRHLSNGDLTFR